MPSDSEDSDNGNVLSTDESEYEPVDSGSSMSEEVDTGKQNNDKI